MVVAAVMSCCSRTTPQHASLLACAITIRDPPLLLPYSLPREEASHCPVEGSVLFRTSCPVLYCTAVRCCISALDIYFRTSVPDPSAVAAPGVVGADQGNRHMGTGRECWLLVHNLPRALQHEREREPEKGREREREREREID